MTQSQFFEIFDKHSLLTAFQQHQCDPSANRGTVVDHLDEAGSGGAENLLCELLELAGLAWDEVVPRLPEDEPPSRSSKEDLVDELIETIRETIDRATMRARLDEKEGCEVGAEVCAGVAAGYAMRSEEL